MAMHTKVCLDKVGQKDFVNVCKIIWQKNQSKANKTLIMQNVMAQPSLGENFKILDALVKKWLLLEAALVFLKSKLCYPVGLMDRSNEKLHLLPIGLLAAY